jgi:hypothetical protein
MSSISKICTRIFFATLLAAQSANAFAPIRIRATGSTIERQIAPSINTATGIHTTLYAGATVTSTPIAEGLTKTILRQGNGPSLKLGEVATVSYTCSLLNNDTPFARSNKQKVVVGDGVMIEGWDKALATMYVGEKALVKISGAAAELYGYGKDGVPGFIPSNAAIEIEIEVLDAEEQKTMGVSGVAGMTGSGDLGLLDPSKPRTPDAIAAAYKTVQVQMAIDKSEEKEGLEGWIEKAKGYYFFGFFEGETGEKAPWYLRPSITFPIAFAVVGAGFYITFALGGIRERGGQKLDELDDIVLTMNMVKHAIVLALDL